MSLVVCTYAASCSLSSRQGFSCTDSAVLSRLGQRIGVEVRGSEASLRPLRRRSECHWWLGRSVTGTAGLARAQQGDEEFKVGSPIVIVEPPPMLKTAEPMPMMRVNKGLIKPGDAGRIIDRRPKDVWAVRFAVGAYLVDRKYFKALSLD